MTHDDQLSANSELDWQAFRYIAGEMSEPEATVFESQLAEDQVAREAVARAVELTETVSAFHFDLDEQRLEAQVSLPGRGRLIGWWPAVVWASLGAAASLLLVLAWQGLSQNESPVAKALPSRLESPGETSDELAEVWSETREPLLVEGELADSILLAAGDDPDLIRSEEPLAELMGDENELTAPDWMLAALEDLAGDEAEKNEELRTP